jgi:hypothetical protein
MISKMDNVEEHQQGKGSKHYRRLRNEVKTATEKAKNEYLDSMCEDIT